MRLPHGVVSAILLIAVGCASPPELEFADWMLPVPDGTPVLEYAPVPPEERDPNAVQLIEDLVIGRDRLAWSPPIRGISSWPTAAFAASRCSDRERPPFPPHAKRDIHLRSGALEAGVDIDSIDWPNRFRAIESIRGDSAGRLYVFPELVYEGDRTPERRPVDVYSPDGHLLAAGFVPTLWDDEIGRPRGNWSYAAGEHVYGLRPNAAGELDVVRYRIELR
jgi:hypothetical protein